MAARKSLAPGKRGAPDMSGLAAGGKKGGGSAPEGRTAELFEKAFDAYQINGKVARDDVPKVLASSMGRYLERELEEMVEEHDDGAELEHHDVKQMITNNMAFINHNWSTILAGKTSKDYKVDPTDIFQQLYESTRMLIDSISTGTGTIDLHAVEYILSSCGEEISHEEFDELLDKIKHPRKGDFEMQKLIMYLAGLLEEVGLEGSEMAAKVMVRQIEGLRDPSILQQPLPKAAAKGKPSSAPAPVSASIGEPPAAPKPEDAPRKSDAVSVKEDAKDDEAKDDAGGE